MQFKEPIPSPGTGAPSSTPAKTSPVTAAVRWLLKIVVLSLLGFVGCMGLIGVFVMIAPKSTPQKEAAHQSLAAEKKLAKEKEESQPSKGWFSFFGGRKTFDSREDAQHALEGKTAKEVLAMLGKADFAQGSYELTTWVYNNRMKLGATGSLGNLEIIFTEGKVITADIEEPRRW